MDVSVGDVIRIGDYTVTVVDIDGDEISFRIHAADNRPDDDGPFRLARERPR